MNVLYTGAASGIAKEVICNLKDDKRVFWYLTAALLLIHKNLR